MAWAETPSLTSNVAKKIALIMMELRAVTCPKGSDQALGHIPVVLKATH